MIKRIFVFVLAFVLLPLFVAFAGGKHYSGGILVEENTNPKIKLNEGDLIINKKGLKQEVLLKLGWGSGDYEVGLMKDESYIGPACMFIDHNKNIYIGDAINNRIMVYSSNGKLKMIVDDNFGGGIFTVDETGKIYSYRGDLYIFSKNGEILEKARVPRMASKYNPTQLIIKDDELLLFDGLGYQQVITKTYTDKWGYHSSELGTYFEGYPFENVRYPKAMRYEDVRKQFAKLGYSSVMTGPFYRGKESVVPSSIYESDEHKHILQLYSDIEPAETIILYDDYLAEFEPNRIFIDNKGNVYQMRSTELGLEVVAWSE